MLKNPLKKADFMCGNGSGQPVLKNGKCLLNTFISSGLFLYKHFSLLYFSCNMLVILLTCMQETRNSCGLYDTFIPYSSLATKHDNTMTWPFLLSSDNTIKENSLSSTFRLHSQSSNNQYQLLMSI